VPPHRNSFSFDDNAQYGVVAFGAGPEGNLPVTFVSPRFESQSDALKASPILIRKLE
jgi:hypothetical protein